MTFHFWMLRFSAEKRSSLINLITLSSLWAFSCIPKPPHALGLAEVTDQDCHGKADPGHTGDSLAELCGKLVVSARVLSGSSQGQ